MSQIRAPLIEYRRTIEGLRRLREDFPSELSEGDHDRRAAAARQRLLQTEFDFTSGIERGLNSVYLDASDLATQAESAVVSAFRGMEDALVNFARTGKLDFKDLADSIIEDLGRIAIQQAIVAPLAQGLGGLFNSGATGATGATISGGGVSGPVGPGGIAVAASGGLVRGPGGPRDDAIPALLSNGEFVVNAGATRRHLPLLSTINARGFRDGGVAGSVSGRYGGDVNVQILDQRRSGEQVEVEETQGGDGGRSIRVFIRDTVRDEIGSGRLDGPLTQRFNMDRRTRR